MKNSKLFFVRTFWVVLVVMVAALNAGCEKEPSLGEVTYLGTCKACHANGLNGAPIFGNKKMWGNELAKVCRL